MKGKILKNITKILAILVICLISYVGIYVQKSNRMDNIVKSYEYTKELQGYRQVILEVSDATEVQSSIGKIIGNTDNFTDAEISENNYTKTDIKVNKENDINIDNYKKTKTLLEKRLKVMKVDDYNISLDNNTGSITILLPENSDTDTVISNLTEVGKFTMKDSETGEEFIGNRDIKKASSVYNTATSGTTVYLQIEFDKNGKKTLKDLSTGEYATKEDTESEESDEEESANLVEANVVTEEKDVTQEENIVDEDEENKESSESETTETEKETQKKITLAIDENELITTSFDEPMVDGALDLSMGQPSTDADTISSNLKSTSRVALIINNGPLPLVYKVSNNIYVQENKADNIILYSIITILVITILLIAYLIIRFKTRGIWAVLGHLGFGAIYLLIIRYTNVNISISSIVAILIAALLNFEINRELLLNTDKYKKTYISFVMKMIPIYAISIIFSFINWTVLNTFGMILFWGITLMVLYNLIITKILIKAD